MKIQNARIKPQISPPSLKFSPIFPYEFFIKKKNIGIPMKTYLLDMEHDRNS